MNGNSPREHVDLIREVFSYSRRFRNSLFVFKIDCPIIEHPSFSLLVKDLALLHQNDIKVVIVPGARERINEVLNRYEISQYSEGGIRISSEKAIDFIRMAAFDISNKVMTFLSGCNIQSVIGNWVRARTLGVVDGKDYEYTGRVDRVRTEAVESLLQGGYIPIFPCIGWNANGAPYNISSDELAGTIASSMKASKLFFLSAGEVPSKNSCALPEDVTPVEKGRISKLSLPQTERLISMNEGNPLVGRLRLAMKACGEGVHRVHLLDGRVEGVVLQEIFSNLGIGTMIYSNVYERIRPMAKQDIGGVLSLMRPLIDQGVLIPRDRRELENSLDDYAVYAVDDIIHGCGALHLYGGGKGEIAGIAVDKRFTHLDIGGKILSYLLQRAGERKLKEVFVLTTQSSDWFLTMGFLPGGLEDLPLEKRRLYNKDRNSRILVFRNGSPRGGPLFADPPRR